ncbi:MAG: protein translocase subunit SecD [bacterium]|nr:protein translocase subunit SecD [bacterium]
MARRSFHKPIIVYLLAAIIVIVAVPQNSKQWAPKFLRDARLHFGLDLAGGTQLDFRISEQEIRDQISQLKTEITQTKALEGSSEAVAVLELQVTNMEEQQRTLVESIRTVIERRINALGVSEAVITPSYIGNEKHLLVECPGIVDTQKCIETVGKTIKLEFKEEFTEATDEYQDEVRTRAKNAKATILAKGGSLEIVGQDLGDELGIAYVEEGRYFRDTLPEGLESLWNKSPNGQLYEQTGTITSTQSGPDGNPITSEIEGIFLSEITRARTETGRVITDPGNALARLALDNADAKHATHDNNTLDDSVPPQVAAVLHSLEPGALNTVTVAEDDVRLLFLESFAAGREEMSASHILVTYKGATSAASEITRTKEEALAKVLELKNTLNGGASFATLAQKESDGPSGEKGGSLGTFGRGTMVPAFSDAAFALSKGEITPPVETAFGYHLIKADSDPVSKKDIASYQELLVSGNNAGETTKGFLAQLQNGEVRSTEEMVFIRSLFFSLLPTGWQDTQLDGKNFRTATVTLDPITNIPVVQINFDDEGADLFQELTARNINKRIAIFVGGTLVSAPTVQTEISGGTAIITGMQNFDAAKSLASDLNTGAIPAPIYLAGQRTVEATLGATALRTSLRAALIGIIILMLYMIIVYRFLGLLADIALSAYAIIFFAILKMPLFLISSDYIVLTLAGMAGIILSIGMAVDANVLIFERMKEEMRKGKLLSTAAETGFKRAWPSIRDGNVSTLITCAILFTIGTSIVRGFAITLGMGVILSMLTAILVTRLLIRKVAETPLGNRPELFGGK